MLQPLDQCDDAADWVLSVDLHGRLDKKGTGGKTFARMIS